MSSIHPRRIGSLLSRCRPFQAPIVQERNVEQWEAETGYQAWKPHPRTGVGSENDGGRHRDDQDVGTEGESAQDPEGISGTREQPCNEPSHMPPIGRR
jgi:hypothetical protein